MAAVSALLVVAMGVFLLDLLQMRGLRPEEAQQAVLIGGLLQEAKYFTAVLVLLALGVGSLRSARGLARKGSEERAGAPGIVTRSR